VLLEDVLESDRAIILAHPERTIPTAKIAKLNTLVAQRAQHVPLAYIRGKAPFFGREFIVNPHVLIPRPETEIMLELLKKLPMPTAPLVADVGTGSGCIGITAALELPGARVSLYDLDPLALNVAAQNAQQLHAEVTCMQSDVLTNLTRADVITANLPYVPNDYGINRAAGHEPERAIFGGKDGLSVYRRFWLQAGALAHTPHFILTESLPEQHAAMRELAKKAGYNQLKAENFIQVFKRQSD
jgi:release factor glutamine methyltransferase